MHVVLPREGQLLGFYIPACKIMKVHDSARPLLRLGLHSLHHAGIEGLRWLKTFKLHAGLTAEKQRQSRTCTHFCKALSLPDASRPVANTSSFDQKGLKADA